MTKNTRKTEITNPKAFGIGVVLVLIATILTSLFIRFVVLPFQDNYISLYVPAKNGGNTYILTTNDFEMVAVWSFVIGAILVGIILLFLKMRKYEGAALTSLLMGIGALLYLPVLLGNGFDALLGGAWSIAGVVLALAFIFTVEAKLFSYLKIGGSHSTNNRK